MAPRLVPLPVAVVLWANAATGLHLPYLGARCPAAWIEHVAAATVRAARLARAYVEAVRALQERWREQLRGTERPPRTDAAAWAIIDLLPAHPMISAPVAAAATGRAKSRVYEGIEQLVGAGVLLPISHGHRNRWWEATGLLDLIARLEAGELPPAAR